MIKETVTLEETAEYLNELLKTDPGTINALFNIRSTCTEAFANHPTVQVGCQGEGKNRWCQVGFIGILNGLFGIDEKGWGHLVLTLDNGAITGFSVLSDSDIIGFESGEQL